MAGPSRVRVTDTLPAEAAAAAVGVLSGILCGAIRVPFEQALQNQLAFLTFYPAVTIAAWLGGLVGGLTAIVTSLVLVSLVVAPELSSATIVGTFVFVGAGVLISVLGEQFRGSQRRASEPVRRASFLPDVAKLLGARIDRTVGLDALAHAV